MIGIVLIFYGFLGLEFVKGGPFIGAMILIAWGSAAIIESYIQLQMCMSLPLVSCPAYNPGLFLLIVAGGFILIGIYAIVCEADTDWDHKIALNYLRLSYCARVILLMRVGSSYLVRRIKPV